MVIPGYTGPCTHVVGYFFDYRPPSEVYIVAFTTWTDERTKVRDEIANLNLTLSSISIKGRTKVYRRLKELQDYLEFIDKQIAKEVGTRKRLRVADVSGV